MILRNDRFCKFFAEVKQVLLFYAFDHALDGSQHNAGNIADCRAKVQHRCGAVMLTDDGKLVAV